MRLRNLIPAEAKLHLFKAAILPHLTYCHLVWHFCRASDTRRLERVQERGQRTVFKDKQSSYQQLLVKAKLPSLYNVAKCNLGKVKFKTMPVSGRPTLRLRGDLFELSAGGASWFALHLLACLLACVKGHFARLFSSLFLGNFACCIIKPVFSIAMSSRQTNNSHSVSLFSDTSQVPVSTSADASSHSSTASTSSLAAAIFPAMNVPDPAFLAAVVNAVKVALAAEKTPPSSDSATVPVSVPDPSCSSSLRVSGGVPSQADLGARTATFLSSGLGFSSSQAASPSPASSGRNNCVSVLRFYLRTLPPPLQVQCLHLALWSRLRVRAWLAPHPLLTCRLVRSCNSLLSSALAFPRFRPRPLTRS